MNENNSINVESEKLKEKDTQKKFDFVSFSEVDKDGNFIEACGYFEKVDSNKTLDERVEEIASRLRR